MSPLEDPVGGYVPLPSNKLFPAWERFIKWARILALIVAAGAGYRYWKSQAPTPVVVIARFPAATQWSSGDSLTMAPALSHNGKLAAYASDREGSGALAIWVQPLDSGKPTRVTSGEFHETDPDFSPDDRSIAYYSERDGGGIYVTPLTGGAPRLLARDGWKPKFSPDGKWIAYSSRSGSEDSSSALGVGAIFVMPAEGGEPKRIQPQFPFARYPVWALDSKRLLFPGMRSDGVKDWWVSSLDGGEAIRTNAFRALGSSMTAVGFPEQWRGDKVLFSASEERQPHLWELTVSTSNGQASGPPRRLTDGDGIEQHSAVGRDGRVLFATVKVRLDLWNLPLDPNGAKALGKLEQLTKSDERLQVPYLARDASKLIYLSDRSGVADIWLRDLDTNTEEAVTSYHSIGYRPVISPDGRLIAYPTQDNGACAVMMQPVGRIEQARALPGCFGIWDWSPDGASLLTYPPASSMNQVDQTPIAGGKRRTVLRNRTQGIYGARFSPDARWIAFSSGTNIGNARVFIAPARNPAAAETEWIPITTSPGGEPAWSPDGNVLYFRSKQDGYDCIWARRLGSGKRPAGEPIPIQHLHSAALGLYLMKPTEFNLAVGKDRLTLNLAKAAGSLRAMKPRNGVQLIDF